MEWTRSGENDWAASAPSGATALYEGPRFTFVAPPPGASINQRFALNFDFSFSHSLTLSRSGAAPGALSPETPFDRLATWARYAVEPQAGHGDFDRRVYAALDDVEAGQTLIARGEARRLILELFDLGVKRIKADHRGLDLKLGYAPSPAMDGGAALSAIVTRLDALAEAWPRETVSASASRLRTSGPGIALAGFVGWLFPHIEAPAWRLPPINGRSLAFAWGGCWLAAILVPGWLLPEHGAHQLDSLGHPDWTGIAALLAAIVLPAALLAARRADAHRVLGAVLLGAVLALPFSAPLRVVEVNRLAARDEHPIPAEIVNLLESDAGSFAVVIIADRPMEWPLSPDQATLAREGRLCAAGKTVEGLRGLRYVSNLRVWPCRRLNDVTDLPST